MKKLTYTLLAEGIAEDVFIPAYIEKLAKANNIQAVRSRLKISASRMPSKSKVSTYLQDACNSSLNQNNEQLFIAGIDLDKPDPTDEQELHEARIQELKNKLGKLHSKYKDKIILFVPVQCVDHWLYYQYYKVAQSKKPPANSLESTNNKEVKKVLYGDKIDRRRIEVITEKIVSVCNFDELARQSKSFRSFHEQVTDFINRF